MSQEPRRRPLTGSCHCGTIQYIVHLTLPHPHNPLLPPGPFTQRIYRCNCTVCHKIGQFHVRPASPTHDFLLLSPDGGGGGGGEENDPLAQLGDYTCYAGNLHFYFCKTCAVRCFIFAGDGEFVDVDMAAAAADLGGAAAGGGGGGGGESAAAAAAAKKGIVRAWRPRLGGGHPDMGHYLSVNGHTIDAGQGFDMRELTEKKHVMYCDCYSPEEDEVPMRYGKPQLHGSY